VPGIGPRRRRALLTKFGSLAAVRRASREDLAAEIGAKAADAVLAFFAGRP
jgi:excinuclease ABC subunit C